MTAIPILDISRFRANPDAAAAADFAQSLLEACHDPGFVYLTGHGIDPADETELFDAARSFFATPESERRSLAIANSPAFRGYTILGDEMTAGANDWRDQLDVGPEQTAPPPATTPAWRRLRGPNQWPASVPELRTCLLDWMDSMEQLGLDALRALAIGLGHRRDLFDGYFVPESDVHVKVIRYPARDAADENRQGVGPHHDSGLLTFILQDSTGGLEVEIDGSFVPAPPVEGAYIMNLGEMLQRATDGYLSATRHRVVSPAGAERLSIAYFMNPCFESVFEPIVLPPHLAALAPGGDNASPDDPVHTLFGENNLKIRLRAHPDVAAQHYSDVTA